MFQYNKIMPSRVRVLHASPDAPPVDVYVNDQKVISDLAFKNFSEYLTLRPNDYNIKVYPAGKKNKPVIEQNLRIPPRSTLTVAAIGELKNIDLLVIEDERNTSKETAKVRFIHLSPNAPAVDVRLADGTTLFSDKKYKDISNYIPVTPKTYTLKVYPAGKNQKVLEIPNLVLSNLAYTVYAIGLLSKEPPLQSLTSIDGNYFPRLEENG